MQSNPIQSNMYNTDLHRVRLKLTIEFPCIWPTQFTAHNNRDRTMVFISMSFIQPICINSVYFFNNPKWLNKIDLSISACIRFTEKINLIGACYCYGRMTFTGWFVCSIQIQIIRLNFSKWLQIIVGLFYELQSIHSYLHLAPNTWCSNEKNSIR